MPAYQFVLAMVLAVHSEGVATAAAVYLLALSASLHLGVAAQVLQVQQRMRERVRQAANVKLTAVTLDTDTTVHTLFGNQVGGRKGYNAKNKGKKSYQPIPTFLAETREYIRGELRNGDRAYGRADRPSSGNSTVGKQSRRVRNGAWSSSSPHARHPA
jgi:hypothetical protein